MLTTRLRKRHRMMPLLASDAIVAPSLGGLDDALRSMVGHSEFPSSEDKLLVDSSPQDQMSPGDLMSPGGSMAPGGKSNSKPMITPARGTLPTLANPAIGKPWTLAQHGMTTTEHAIYLCLYNAPTTSQANPNWRLASLSVSALSRYTGLPDRTCQRAIRSLELKRVLEIARVAKCEAGKPPIYRVKSYSAIMDTWRALGLTNVTGGRGRVLVDPRNASRCLGGKFGLESRQLEGTPPKQEVDLSEELSPGDAMSPPPDNMSGGPGDIMTGGPGDMVSPLLRKSLRKKDNKAAAAISAEEVAAVLVTVGRYGHADETAAIRIIESCRRSYPKCEIQDILTTIEWKGSTLQNQTGIRSLTAILIHCCVDLVPEAIRCRQELEQKQLEEAIRAEKEMRRLAVLDRLNNQPKENAWTAILDKVRPLVLRQTFETFLAPTSFAGIVNGELQVYVPSPEFKHIESRFSEQIIRVIRELRLDIQGVKCLTVDELIDVDYGSAESLQGVCQEDSLQFLEHSDSTA